MAKEEVESKHQELNAAPAQPPGESPPVLNAEDRKNPREPGEPWQAGPPPQAPASATKNAEEGDSQSASQASVLMGIAKEAEVFHDPNVGKTYARFQSKGHWEASEIKGSRFKDWLRQRYYQQTETAPNDQTLNATVKTTESRAKYGGQSREVFVRVAEHDGAIYLDLVNEHWQAVKVTPEGWSVVDTPPVLFVRPKAMKALPTPALGGDLQSLRNLIPVDDENWALLLGWLVAAFRPTGPYPILVFHSEQGSGKSTASKLLRGCLDPNQADLRSQPSSEHDLVIAASNAHLLAYDNLSKVPVWLSDCLCRLATGGGFATRALYENDEETVFNSQNPIILNSIEEVVNRSDLLDRCLLLELSAIPPSKRRTLESIHSDFEEALPGILGAMLTAVSGAMSRLPTTRLDNPPRMADFAKWASAAETSLGLAPGRFMAAYHSNREDAHDLAIESSPVGRLILRLVEREGEWSGSATELLAALKADSSEVDRSPKAWPKSPQAMGGELTRLTPNLRENGVGVERSTLGRNRKKSRLITLKKISPHYAVPSDPTVPTPDIKGSNGDHGDEAAPSGDGKGATVPEAISRLPSGPGDSGDGGDGLAETHRDHRRHPDGEDLGTL